ncbi:hypothetical protein JCM10296v2_004682 [Rhodotorula toruloides]
MTPTTFAAMALNVASLPNLEAIKVSCKVLNRSLQPSTKNWRRASTTSSPSSDPSSSSDSSDTESAVNFGTRFVNNETSWSRDTWSAHEAASTQALSIQLAQTALRQGNSCFKSLALHDLRPRDFDQTLDLLANPAALTSLTLTSWSKFYIESDMPSIQALSRLVHLETLHVSGADPFHYPKPKSLQPFPSLSTVRSLSIRGYSPRVPASPSSGDRLAKLPCLRHLDLRASWRDVDVLSAFSPCTLSSFSWIEAKDSHYCVAGHGRVTLARLLRLEQLHTSLRTVRITPRSRMAWVTEEMQELSQACRDRGASLEVELGVDNLGDLPKDPAVQANTMQDTLAWAATHVEWLARLGDDIGLKQMWDVLYGARQRQAVALT